MSPPNLANRELAPLPSLLAPAAGKRSTTQQLTTQLQIEIGGGNPTDLHTVIDQLITEEAAIDQWRIDKIPGVAMLLIEITDP